MSASSLLLPFIIVAALTQDFVASDEFRADCQSSVCPSVSWVDGAAGDLTEFVLTSSQRKGGENWVSFAFADKPSMLAAQFVVDCYDLGDMLRMGASRNSLAPVRTNRDSPADKEKLTNSTVVVHRGVYNCTFLMNLPSTASYVIMAEGKLYPGGNTSSPRKKGHGSIRWASISAYRFRSNVAAADDEEVARPNDDFPSIGAGSAASAAEVTAGPAAKNAAAASDIQMTPPNAAASKNAANSANSLAPPAMLVTLQALPKCSTPADAKFAGYDFLVKALHAAVAILVSQALRELAGVK